MEIFDPDIVKFWPRDQITWLENSWSIFFWFLSPKLGFNYHFHMNVTCSTQKLPFPRFLTLKVVPKPFWNYPKFEVFGQFLKNSSMGFLDFLRSSQYILVFIVCQVEDYQNMLKLNCRPLDFISYKAFLKSKQKQPFANILQNICS